MGLAPWHACWGADDAANAAPLPLLRGALADGSLQVDWSVLEALPDANRWESAMDDGGGDADDGEGRVECGDAERARRGLYTRLAASAQASLEGAVMPWLASLRERTGESNLCLVGGVALNSVLNGRISREVRIFSTTSTTHGNGRISRAKNAAG